jgi:hypothetical protein
MLGDALSSYGVALLTNHVTILDLQMAVLKRVDWCHSRLFDAIDERSTLSARQKY